MTYPVFTNGQVLPASDLNAIGLWLVKSQAVSASAVTSVTVTSCFNSDFKNYLVIAEGINASNDGSLSFQLVSGTTPAAANYYGALTFVNAGSVQQATDNNASAASFAGAHGTNLGVSLNLSVVQPYQAATTAIYNGSYTRLNYYGVYNGFHADATSYNGLKISPQTGTINSGTIRVYGLRN